MRDLQRLHGVSVSYFDFGLRSVDELLDELRVSVCLLDEFLLCFFLVLIRLLVAPSLLNHSSSDSSEDVANTNAFRSFLRKEVMSCYSAPGPSLN